MILKKLLIVGILVIFACKSEQNLQNSEEYAVRMKVVDSLGVDIGDPNFIFGKISDAMFTTDSTFVVIDASTGIILKYCINDVFSFISSTACRGIGPSLLTDPFQFQLLDSNRVALFSQGVPPEMLILNNQLDVITGRNTLESRGTIDSPVLINDSTLAGCTYDYEPNPNGGSIILKRIIGQWDLNTGEYNGEYYSDEYTIDIDEFDRVYDVKVALECCMTADLNDNLYFAPSIYDNIVYIYNSEFNAIDTIGISLLPGTRDQFELNLETECRKLTDGEIGNWQPQSGYLGVFQLHTQDEAKLLWIRHGSLIEPTYDVYTYGGEYQYCCIVEGLPNQEIIQMNINDCGAIAYAPQPYDYPRVYIIKIL
jgi:hypothetical protein